MADVSIKYTVHGATRSTVQRMGTFGGEEVEAQVPCLVVELVSDGGAMGHSFTFIGTEAAAALELFTPGEPIVVNFSQGE